VDLLYEILFLLCMANTLLLEPLNFSLEFEALLHQVVIVLFCLLFLSSDLLNLFVRIHKPL
jgi:hypothetical protein